MKGEMREEKRRERIEGLLGNLAVGFKRPSRELPFLLEIFIFCFFLHKNFLTYHRG